MWDNPNIVLPSPASTPRSREGNPLASGSEPPQTANPPLAENPLQRLLAESSAEELARQLTESPRPSESNPMDLVSRSMMVLSTMAAELGVILRVQVRSEKVRAWLDEEKIRRVLNALVIHLLSVSQSAGWVTIGLDEQSLNGRGGFSLRLEAGGVILPWKTDPEYEEELNTQAELSLCRKIVEQHGGKIAVHFQHDNKLVYTIWLPA